MDEAEMSPQEKALAAEGLRRSVLTDEQIRQAIQIRDQMRQLGVEADLSKALLDKRHITEEQLRMLSTNIASGNCFRHSDKAAMSRCYRCGRPLCAECVIRVGTMTLCGATCAGPEEERPLQAPVAPVKARRWKWIWIAGVAGGGIALTVLLWFVADYFLGKIDYDAYKDLVARREPGAAAREREIELLEKVAARWPGHAEAHVSLARGYRRSGEVESALRTLTKFLRRKPDDPAATFELAECYMALRDLPKAREQWEKLLRLEPDHIEAARNLARLMAEHFSDEVEAVEKNITASLALQPQDRMLRYHLAKIYKRRGLVAEAAKEIEAVLKSPRPGMGGATARERAALSGTLGAEIYLLAAELKLGEGKMAAAIPLLEQSRKWNPASVLAGTLLTRLYVKSDQTDKARSVLSDLCGRVASDARVWEVKAEFDLSVGDLDAYAKDLEKVYALRPGDVEVGVKLFKARLDVGDVKSAALLLDELSSRGDKRVVELRARLALEGGKLEEAKRLLEGPTLADSKEPSVALMRARIERASGRPEGAAALLRGIIESVGCPPGVLATARIHLGLALWQSRDADSAAAEFERVVSSGCAERIVRAGDKLLRLANGEVPHESAVYEVTGVVRKAFTPSEAPIGPLGIAQLSWAKGPLSAAAFAGLDDRGGLGKARTLVRGTVPARRARESRSKFLKRCAREAAASELAVAHVLASKEGVTQPASLSQADKLASGGGHVEAMSLALDAQLDMVCQLLARGGMNPVSEFLRRKAAALAAVQDASDPKAVATAYVLAEGLARVLSAGEAGWAYEHAARNVVDSLYAADGACKDAADQMCSAQRAHVLLLNMLALKRRDARLVVGP